MGCDYSSDGSERVYVIGGVPIPKILDVILSTNVLGIMGETHVKFQSVTPPVIKQPACDSVLPTFQCFPEIP